jgi:hypothetical protein
MLQVKQGGFMRSILFLWIGFLLFPLFALGDAIEWEDMEKPYFVYNATGISVGWYQGTQHTYMIASDLNNVKAYASDFDGAEEWPPEEQVIVDGATRVCASRNVGLEAAAIVPSGAGSLSGVHFTTNGGQTWTYREDEPGFPWEQPVNRHVISVGMHPNSTDFVIVGCEQSAPNSTMWVTLDGGINWEPKTDPNGRYWDRTNSIRFPPDDPGTPGSRSFYACRDVTGLWLLQQDGLFWINTPNPYGSGDYEALDFAKCPSHIQRNYLLTVRDSDYKLWFAPRVDIGPWTEVHDFGDEAVFEILDTSEYPLGGVPDTAWVMSSENIYMFEIDLDNPTIYTMETFPSGINHYAWMDYTPPGGADGDYPTLYVAREYSMEKLKYNTLYSNWIWEYRLNGTNTPFIASVSEGLGTIANGAGLHVLGEDGGYVFVNKKLRDSNWPNDWEFQSSLLQDPQVSSATGVDVSAYYDDGSVKTIAIGSGQDGSETYWIAINNGQPVTFDDAPDREPSSLDACAGRKNPNSLLEGKPYIGGKYHLDQYNIVWKLTTETYANRFYEDFSPLFKDMILLEDPIDQDFNPLGVGSTGPWGTNKAVYMTGFNEEIYLDNGIDYTYSVGAVAQSDERSSEGIDVLYAGPDQFIAGHGGMYKNHFDLQTVTPWYQIVNGMRDDINMLSVTTTKHLVDCGEPLDPIVVYALGEEPSTNDLYTYISADSGRSWIEFGQYLRDFDIGVNKSELIMDDGTQERYYFALAGEDGIYRYPYNVKSGTLAGNETWGPGPIIVNGDVTVPYGVTLTIVEGTEVIFIYDFDRLSTGGDPQKSELVVQGTLIAEGIEGNLITFHSSRPSDPGPGDWNGIKAIVGSTVNLDYCLIKDGEIGLQAGSATELIIENCTIEDMTETGISLTNAPSGTTISSSRIQNCGNYGIYCLGGFLTASGDTIADNRYGVNYWGYDDITIQDCLITNPGFGSLNSYYGIRIKDFLSISPEPHILNDSIAGFDQGGIYFDGVTNTSAVIAGTSVYACGKFGIYFQNSSAEINGGAATKNLLVSNPYGLDLESGSSPKIRRTKFLDNNYRGADIAAGCHPDLGTIPDAGNNSFIRSGAPGTSYKHVYNHNLLPIDAIYNYWSPLDPALIVNTNYIPYLPLDPLWKIVPDQDRTPLAQDFALAKSYPNPFNPATTISFNISSPSLVSVKVFNIMGQEVRTLFAGESSPGENTLVWDGKNEDGIAVSAGVYLVQMRSGECQRTIKTTMLK